ncbi:MAG: DUF4325 domain-containing protein [bacterium]
MDIPALIIKRIKKSGSARISEIVKATGYSRQYINKYFQELRNEGEIKLLGRANKAFYVPAKGRLADRAQKNITRIHRILVNKGLSEDVVFNEIKQKSGVLFNIPKNVLDIINYAFTEMLNNAIEHSQSKKIEITIVRNKRNINFNVVDRGIGIYNNIMQKKRLRDSIEAIQDLLKGKETTAPQEHSGEGIFFTSKVADFFSIQSSKKKLIFENTIDDIFIKDIRYFKGTKIFFLINIDTEKQIGNIFREYTDDSFEFKKTKVTVKLYKKGLEYVSRSQARRILSGLDKFKTIYMDFKNIETVGQGFADEVFHVWKSHNPGISVLPLNANENVHFMINRAKKSVELSFLK